jgi:hypothetical protein
MNRIPPPVALVLAALAGALYGFVARWVFGPEQHGVLAAAYSLMSLAFLFLVPFTIGYLTLAAAPREALESRAYVVFMPWMAVAFGIVGVWLSGWEGKICITMLLPIFLPMANAGGAAALSVRRRQDGGRLSSVALVAVLLLPYLAGAAESGIPTPSQLRVVEESIDIRAAPAAVWTQIARVPRISPREYPTSLVHRIGFPRPVEATLSHEGVGGVRRASFERGVVFTETVTTWRPGSELAFTIQADPATIPAAALDPHVTVGGEYFDVLDGSYRIESLAGGRVRLHLASTHRLSTRFNPYASLWSDLVMRQIQRNILGVVKARAERGDRLQVTGHR